jgi:hypothetical protein
MAKGKPGRPKSEPTKPKAYVEFTPERRALFLEHLEEHGTFYEGCAGIGITYSTLVNHRKKDTEFDQQVEMAHQRHVDMLVRVATGRAVHGVSKPIVGGRNKDEIVAHEQVYSDGLMQTLLKSKRTEFGAGGSDGGAGGGSGPGGRAGGLLIVPAAPHSVTEWHKLYGEKAKGQTGKPGAKPDAKAAA